MIVHKDIDISAPLTEKQRKMLAALAELEPVPDEDCPAPTAEQLQQFKRVSDIKQKTAKKHP